MYILVAEILRQIIVKSASNAEISATTENKVCRILHISIISPMSYLKMYYALE